MPFKTIHSTAVRYAFAGFAAILCNLSWAQGAEDVSLCRRGWEAYGANNMHQALEDYAQAQVVKPQQADAYFNRGIVYEKQNRMEDAKAQFRLAYANGLRSPGLTERMAVHGLTGNPPAQVSMNEPAASILSTGLFLRLAG